MQCPKIAANWKRKKLLTAYIVIIKAISCLYRKRKMNFRMKLFSYQLFVNSSLLLYIHNVLCDNNHNFFLFPQTIYMFYLGIFFGSIFFLFKFL